MMLYVGDEGPTNEGVKRHALFVIDSESKIIPLLFDVFYSSESPDLFKKIGDALDASAGEVYSLAGAETGQRIVTPIRISNYPKHGSWSEWAAAQLTMNAYLEIGETPVKWSVGAKQIIPRENEIIIGLDGHVMIFAPEIFDEPHYNPSCDSCQHGRRTLRFDLEQINNCIITTPSNAVGYLQFGRKRLNPHPDQKLWFTSAGAPDYVGLWQTFQREYQSRVAGILEVSSIREMRLNLRND